MHDLTESDGKVLFVYNRQNGHPWHKLGTEFPTYLRLDEALEASGSMDTVIPVVLYAQTDDGMIEVEDSVGLWSDKYGLLTTKVGPDYVPTQRREIAELAYEIVGLSQDDAQVDTMGNLGDKAQRFFTYIKVPELVIDPNGIADTIERGITAATSFDGSLPNLIFYTDIRVVCQNTLNMAMKSGMQMIRVKHTKNSEARINEAARALGYIGAREKEIIKKAEDMLRVNGDDAMRRVLDNVWPVTGDIDDKTKTRRQNERENVRYLYEGEGNFSVDFAGRTGWAAYNAVVEYIDHYRPVRGKEKKEIKRAEAAVLPGTYWDQKAKVAELVLN